ncbi:MAG: hypothetical protein QOH41_1529 [Blastocatellia bacterium]|nr:hypothetical protein [Blastocatellia bacterium]
MYCVGRPSCTRRITNRWTGATASELLIKVIRFYHGACYRAVARSTLPLCPSFLNLWMTNCTTRLRSVHVVSAVSRSHQLTSTLAV